MVNTLCVEVGSWVPQKHQLILPIASAFQGSVVTAEHSSSSGCAGYICIANS